MAQVHGKSTMGVGDRRCKPTPTADTSDKQLSLAARIEFQQHRFFAALGHWIAAYNVHILVAGVLVSCLASIGAIWFYEENNVRYDFSATDAPSQLEYAAAQSFFGESGRMFFLVSAIRARDRSDSLLKPDRLKAVANLTEFLESGLSVTVDGRKYSYRDFCSGACLSNAPVELFARHYSAELRHSPNMRFMYPTMEFFSEFVYLANNFLGVSLNDDGTMHGCSLIVLNFRAAYANETMTSVIHAWIRAAFDLSRQIESDPSSPIDMHVINEDEISKEIRRTGLSTLPYLAVTLVAILLFSIAVGFRVDPVRSKPWESAGGVFTSILALTAGFGLMFWCGVRWVPLANVAPFLVLAIGVDDVFISLHAWHGTDVNAPPSDRLSRALREAGPGITITSLTNALSFGIGAMSPTPAIKLFCAYTCAALAVEYFYQILFFSALLYRGGVREAAGFNGNTLFWQAPKGDRTPRLTMIASSIRAKVSSFLDHYAKFTSGCTAKVMVAILLCMYLPFSLYGVHICRAELSVEKLFMSDSHLLEFVHLQHKYMFKEGGLLYIFVNKPGDLRQANTQRDLMHMLHEIEAEPESAGSTSTAYWMPIYEDYLEFEYATPVPGFDHGRITDRPFAYRPLPDFLKMTPRYDRWADFIVLNDFACGLNDPDCVEKFLVTTGFRNATTWPMRLDLLQRYRSIVKRYAHLDVTIYEDWAMYADQILSIAPSARTTSLIALVCMAIVCALLMPRSIACIAMATAAVCSINVGVIGGLSLWQVDLDPISATCILMAIGCSVDFTAHVTYQYYMSTDECARGRVRSALGAVAAPTLQAGLSTLLASFSLIAVDAYMIRTFLKTVTLVVGSGLAHGLLVMPVVLATASQLRLMCNGLCGGGAEVACLRVTPLDKQLRTQPA